MHGDKLPHNHACKGVAMSNIINLQFAFPLIFPYKKIDASLISTFGNGKKIRQNDRLNIIYYVSIYMTSTKSIS